MGGSDPYKTISFKTGNEGLISSEILRVVMLSPSYAASLSLEDTFAQVKFEWPGDRSVKVVIQESVVHPQYIVYSGCNHADSSELLFIFRTFGATNSVLAIRRSQEFEEGILLSAHCHTYGASSIVMWTL